MEMFLTIKLCTHAKLIICIKMDLALNNLQKLIGHKPKQTIQFSISMQFKCKYTV